jgi:hypothetical protein
MCTTRARVTYHGNVAEHDRHDVRQSDEGAADHNRDSRLEIELIRPESEVEVARDARGVVGAHGICPEAQRSDAHQQSQHGEARTAAVDDPQPFDLGLQVQLLRVYLKVGDRRFVLFRGHLDAVHWERSRVESEELSFSRKKGQTEVNQHGEKARKGRETER